MHAFGIYLCVIAIKFSVCNIWRNNKKKTNRTDTKLRIHLVLQPSGRIRYSDCVDLLVGQSLRLQTRQNVVDDMRVTMTAKSDLWVRVI